MTSHNTDHRFTLNRNPGSIGLFFKHKIKQMNTTKVNFFNFWHMTFLNANFLLRLQPCSI